MPNLTLIHKGVMSTGSSEFQDLVKVLVFWRDLLEGVRNKPIRMKFGM